VNDLLTAYGLPRMHQFRSSTFVQNARDEQVKRQYVCGVTTKVRMESDWLFIWSHKVAQVIALVLKTRI
jgi:hypothetical protein